MCTEKKYFYYYLTCYLVFFILSILMLGVVVKCSQVAVTYKYFYSRFVIKQYWVRQLQVYLAFLYRILFLWANFVGLILTKFDCCPVIKMVIRLTLLWMRILLLYTRQCLMLEFTKCYLEVSGDLSVPYVPYILYLLYAGEWITPPILGSCSPPQITCVAEVTYSDPLPMSVLVCEPSLQ